MDAEKEILALSAQVLAMNILVASVFSKLVKNRALRPAIIEGFDQAADVAERVAIHFGKAASPEHTVKALGIIEELRGVVLGNQGKPKSTV